MKGEEFIAFICGGVASLIVLMGAMYITDSSPAALQRKVHQEAVQLGYGKWIIDTNLFDGTSPKTHFEWVTNVVK